MHGSGRACKVAAAWEDIHASAPGIEGGFGVPLAAFTFAHGGPRIDTPPPTLGQHNEEILAALGHGHKGAGEVSRTAGKVMAKSPTA